MLILGITSSTASVGVSVARDRTILATNHVLTDRRHAEEITPLLAKTTSMAGVDLADVNLVAVDVGPGRFTGLRVGVATARALALGLSVPVVGVSSLRLLAFGVSDRPVAAVIDARRNEVFQQIFTADGESAPSVGPPTEMAKLVPRGAVVVGDGADRYADSYRTGVVPNEIPSAATLVTLAADLPPQPGAEIAPLYLRDPDVQVNIKTRPTIAEGQ